MDINVLRLKGIKLILNTLSERGKARYSELVKSVGFSTTTTRSLKVMEALDLVKREVLDEPYRPVVYSLTARGKRLYDLLNEIEKL